MPSGPAALPALIAFTALLISALVGGLVFTFSRLSAGNIDGRCSGEGLLRVSLKCSAHLVLSWLSFVMILPSLSLTEHVGLVFVPAGVLVIAYSLFMSLFPAAVSASSARMRINFLLSALTLSSSLSGLYSNTLFVGLCLGSG